ncbi:MAG: ABC transporter ATP-binding protein [Lachnospiraceae bacterium]|nr:ABC transporter ATP-binding protein [Lachnospiraceae bacterium]
MLAILKKFFNFCDTGDRRKLRLSMILGVVKAFFAALRIPAIGIVAMGIINNDMSAKHIWGAFGVMCVSVLGQILVGLKTTMLQCEAGYHCSCNKRMEIAEHLRYLPMGYFNRNSLGRITNITTNTMEGLADVATRVIMMTTQGILTTAVITIMIFCFDWRIGVILLIGVAVFGVFNALMQMSAKRAAPRKAVADEALVSAVIEYVQGIAEVKNFNLTGNEARKLSKAIREKCKGDTLLEYSVIPFMTLQNIMTKLLGIAMCVASVKFYFDGSMELLYTVMMTVSSFLVYESLELMGNFSALIRTIDIAVTQAQGVLAEPAMDISGEEIVPKNYDIELKNVGFAYESRRIIDDVSLKIPEKTTTAIVGPSGGGKTTLTSLIARFWDVQEGTVTLGGRNVKEYSFDALMKNFSFVFQRVYLFEDTVANNIRFGEPEASMERVIEAAKKARCHDFIMSLPNGYETVIGEGGASLSGGEKQRISIARAILKDSPVIILDEATANVDPENEAELVKAVEELTRDKTIIMIAHRLKTVRNADQILVVDQGRIVQRGTHEALMKEEGIYRRFVSERSEAASWKIA